MSIPSVSAFTAAVLATALALIPQHGWAQTPGQMEYERQQREYWRQQEQQRQEQQRQQQQMNENARVQQEQSRRFMESTKPSGSYAPGAAQGSPGAGPGAGADPTGAQAASAARAMWEKRPALPPDRNPLLGKWTRPASTRPNPSDPFAAAQPYRQRGVCLRPGGRSPIYGRR